MSLQKKQSEFVRAVALLILYAEHLGYELTFGDAAAVRGHKQDSYHYMRLAIDLNLFKDGKYLRNTEDHEPLGVFWESLGGTWGGRFDFDNDGEGDDGNHYSWGE